MALTVDPPAPDVLDVDAGVIEEARRRQRRHRSLAGTAALIAPAIAAVVLGLVAGGGRDTIGAHSSGPPQPAAPISTIACITVPSSWNTATPPPAFVSLLGVLRRPATPADALPAQISSSVLGNGQDVYVNYVRRAQVIGGRTFYVLPVRFGCGSITPHEGVLLACVLRANDRIIDFGAGSDSTAAQVKADGMFLVGGSCLHTKQATLIAGIVPDRVASITLRYPSSTLTVTVVNNVVVASVQHPGSPLWHPISMTWRAADGHVIKTFSEL